jgi:hypothetical protein
MRKTYVIHSQNCPRCKKNDEVKRLDQNKDHWLTKRVLSWFRSNTTYTESQLTQATNYCDRCSIVFKVEAVQ